MKQLPFTTEQVKILQENPYTFSITTTSIKYTFDFKIFFANQLNKNLSSVKIFQMAGYDPDILGKERIYNFSKRLKKEIASPGGLKDHTMKLRSSNAKADEERRTDTKIKNMQEKIDHLTQELEVLKKTSAACLQLLLEKKKH